MKLFDEYKDNLDEQHYVGILYMDCPFCESGNIKKGIPENYGETIEVVSPQSSEHSMSSCDCSPCGQRSPSSRSGNGCGIIFSRYGEGYLGISCCDAGVHP